LNYETMQKTTDYKVYNLLGKNSRIQLLQAA